MSMLGEWLAEKIRRDLHDEQFRLEMTHAKLKEATRVYLSPTPRDERLYSDSFRESEVHRAVDRRVELRKRVSMLRQAIDDTGRICGELG